MLMARKPKAEPEDTISIKGTKEGLVVTVGEGELLPLMNELARHLQHKAPFFGGAQAILDTGPRELTTEDVGRIRELFFLRKSDGDLRNTDDSPGNSPSGWRTAHTRGSWIHRRSELTDI